MHRLLTILILLIFVSACADQTVVTETREEDGTLTRTERRKKNQAKHGLMEVISPSGTVLERSHFVNDTLSGDQTYFYPDGKILSKVNFEKGLMHGPYIKFHPNGQKAIEQVFDHGALNGLSIRYYPNGQIEERVTMKNNFENGPFEEFFENGQPRAKGNYICDEEGDAIEHGLLQEFDSTGTLIRTAECENGICRTIWKK